jgi:prepilin signal peptidase PulO-like enzyme (type II secretory pathway)
MALAFESLIGLMSGLDLSRLISLKLTRFPAIPQVSSAAKAIIVSPSAYPWCEDEGPILGGVAVAYWRWLASSPGFCRHAMTAAILKYESDKKKCEKRPLCL